MPKVKIQKEEYDKIIQLYKDGNSLRKIAGIYDVTKGSIAKIIPKEEREKNANVNVVTKEIEEDIIATYLKNYSIKEVMNKTKISRNTINRILKDLRITRRKFKLEDKKEEILKLYKENNSFEDISKLYECSSSVIHNLMTHFYEDEIREYFEIRTYKILRVFNHSQMLLIKQYGRIYGDRNLIKIRNKDKAILREVINGVYSKSDIEYLMKNAVFHDGAYILDVYSKELYELVKNSSVLNK